MIGRVPRPRTVTPQLPAEIGVHDGLAYSLWLPRARPPRGGVVILHGAGSCKENHHDFARAALAAGSPRSPSTSAATATARGRWTAARSTTSWRWRRCCARALGDPSGRRRSRCAARAWAATSRSCRGRRRGAARGRRDLPGQRRGPAPRARRRRGSRSRPTAARSTRSSAEHDVRAGRGALDGAGAAAPRRGRRAGPGRALARARRACCRSPRQPADRGARRPPPLDPARRRAAGGQPAVHRAGARAVSIAIAAWPARFSARGLRRSRRAALVTPVTVCDDPRARRRLTAPAAPG